MNFDNGSVGTVFSIDGTSFVKRNGVEVPLREEMQLQLGDVIKTTENALVRGQVTIIGPQLSGYVFEVPVQDFQFVKAAMPERGHQMCPFHQGLQGTGPGAVVGLAPLMLVADQTRLFQYPEVL